MEQSYLRGSKELTNILIQDSIIIGNVGGESTKETEKTEETIEKSSEQLDSNKKKNKIITPYLNITREECKSLIDRIKSLWKHEELINLVDEFVTGLPYFENWQIENTIFICDEVEEGW